MWTENKEMRKKKWENFYWQLSWNWQQLTNKWQFFRQKICRNVSEELRLLENGARLATHYGTLDCGNSPGCLLPCRNIYRKMPFYQIIVTQLSKLFWRQIKKPLPIMVEIRNPNNKSSWTQSIYYIPLFLFNSIPILEYLGSQIRSQRGGLDNQIMNYLKNDFHQVLIGLCLKRLFRRHEDSESVSPSDLSKWVNNFTDKHLESFLKHLD